MIFRCAALRRLSSPASSVGVAGSIQPVRVTGVTWDLRNKGWAYTYYVNGPSPRRRHRGFFSIHRFGFHLAKMLAEKCRLAAERAGLAVISDSCKVTRLKTPAVYQSDVEGVRWCDPRREWRADWITLDPSGRRHRRFEKFPVDDLCTVDAVRIEAERFRRRIDSKLSHGRHERRRTTADYQSNVPGVLWQGPGAGEIRNGVWVAMLVSRNRDGKIARRTKKSFAANKYGFEGAKQLAIEAILNHNEYGNLAMLSSTTAGSQPGVSVS